MSKEKTVDALDEEVTANGAMMRRAFAEFKALGGDSPRALARLVGSVWSQLEDKGALANISGERYASISSEEILDLTDLYHRMGDSTPRVTLILSAFAGCFQDQYNELLAAERSGDHKELESAAHAVKGLLLEVGAKQPAALAANVEQMCRAGGADDARKLIPKLGEQVLLTARLVKHTVAALHSDGEGEEAAL